MFFSLAECAEEVDDMKPGWKKETVKNEREFEREEFSSEEGEKKSAEEVVGVVRLNEQQIQEEIERLRQEKAGIMEALSTMQNVCLIICEQ
ncbi:unnamed protein product [Anisakis simplex]|uniref:RAB6-interacting golgin n=1 Tax=Anisakis simplex TaxID=6269 RepID=A0A0M3JG03_ANISI|nr:unnamed protein product [Anisakis simplex]